jgi:hypothetical protein
MRRSELLDKIETVFIMQKLTYNRNGLMNSVLNKADIMADKWGYKLLLLICDPALNLRMIQAALNREDTRIASVYEYFQKSYSQGLESKAVYKDAGGVYDIYEGEKLVGKEHYTGYNGSLRLAERYKDGKREHMQRLPDLCLRYQARPVGDNIRRDDGVFNPAF